MLRLESLNQGDTAVCLFNSASAKRVGGRDKTKKIEPMVIISVVYDIQNAA